MTFLGKLFVLVNAVFSVAVMTWAIMAYVNRMDWATVEYQDGKKLDDRIKELAAAIKSVQASYGPAQTLTAQAEADLEHRRKRIADRRLEGETGTFYTQYTEPTDKVKPTVEDTRDDPEGPLVFSYRQIWGKLPDEKQIKGVDKAKIKGLKVLQTELNAQIADAVTYSDELAKSIEEHNRLAKELGEFKVKIERQGRIRTELTDERDYLSDARVNFDEQLVTLTKRNRQLAGRLATYEPK